MSRSHEHTSNSCVKAARQLVGRHAELHGPIVPGQAVRVNSCIYKGSADDAYACLQATKRQFVQGHRTSLHGDSNMPVVCKLGDS